MGGLLDLKYFWLIIEPIVNAVNGGTNERTTPPIPADLRPLSTSTMNSRVIIRRSPQLMKPLRVTQIINVYIFLLQPLKL